MKLQNLYFLYYWTVMLSCCFVPVTRKNVPFYTFLMTIICDHINYLVVHKNCKYLYIDRYISYETFKWCAKYLNTVLKYWHKNIQSWLLHSRMYFSVAEMCTFRKNIMYKKCSMRNRYWHISIHSILHLILAG